VRLGGIFLAGIHSPAQVSRVSCIQRQTICYLEVRESLALRISAALAEAERMVPIAMRKRFEGGADV
jgi:hypothetical protein